MPSSSLRCTRCDIPLEPGSDRCPKCLRQSSVVDTRARKRVERDLGPVPVTGSDLGAEGPPKHVAVRIAALAVTWTACAPAVWLIFNHEPWLEAHELWLAACVTALGLSTIPLRAAFSPPEQPLTRREAVRHYAVLMAASVGMPIAFAAAVGAASRMTSDPLYALLSGLLVFLLLLLCGPVLAAALRHRQPWRQAIRALGGRAAMAGAIVGLCVVGAWLKVLKTHDEQRTIVLPASTDDAKRLFDPLDLERVAVQVRRARDPNGLYALHLAADAGDFRRTLAKLSTEALIRTTKLRDDATADGEIHCWLPPRLRTPENFEAMRAEERSLQDAAASTHQQTPAGRPIALSFEFGELPEP